MGIWGEYRVEGGEIINKRGPRVAYLYIYIAYPYLPQAPCLQNSLGNTHIIQRKQKGTDIYYEPGIVHSSSGLTYYSGGRQSLAEIHPVPR